MRPLPLAWLLTAAAFFITTAAHSQKYSWDEGKDSDEEFAVVVMVSDKEIILDRGTMGGVKAGDKVVLYRTLTVHHPVSREEITDRFPIGEVRIAESSELLSIIRNFKKLAYAPKAGDLVLLPKKAPPPKKEPVKQEPMPTTAPDTSSQGDGVRVIRAPCPSTPVSGLSEELKNLHGVFVKSLGSPIKKRIRLYERFLFQYRSSTYAPAIQEEIAWLVGLETVTPREEQPVLRVLHTPLTELEVGDKVQVVIAVVASRPAHGARLFIRSAGQEGFDEVGLEQEGAYYFRGSIPKRYLKEPGKFEYFIEVAPTEGVELPSVASAESPYSVSVTAPVVDTIQRKDRSCFRSMFEYVNFDMDKTVDDEYWAFEADYFYRISTFLYGVRIGMGIFAGTGGKLSEIEASTANNRELSANYGFIEGEFEVVPMFHFMLRLALGNQRSTASDDAMMNNVFGFEGGVRIGEERKTNLVASGAVMQRIGYEARLALEINVFKRVPINLEGLVTNYPVDDSHLGLRLVLGTGFRFTDWLAILARGSWNARTIKHTGFGGGASLALSW